MQEAVRRRTCFVEGVIKCYPDETLDTIIDRIVKAEVGVSYKRHWLLQLYHHITGWEVQDIISSQLFSPLPGPSAGPGEPGWHSEGHHLSVWPAAGHGLNTCRYWCPFVIASRERGAPFLHNYLGRLESWPCTQPGRPWSLLSTPVTFIPTQNPFNLLPYCVVSSSQIPP